MLTFSTKYALESIYLGHDYSLRLDSAEVINSVVFTNSCVGSTDALASAMIGSSYTIAGSVVKVLVTGGIPGFTYQLNSVVVTSGGRVLEGKAKYTVL